MNKQAVNPFLPVNTYIADGEPHVFGNRVYLYGSHDKENGDTYCMLDYEVWSAPKDDLAEWSCSGSSYSASQDPLYSESNCYMYAPDCVQGNDGRYYLFYCLSGYKGFGGYSNPISVAVCDEPDGHFEFHGHVRNSDGSIFREKLCFDPAVINDQGTIRIYFGSELHWFNVLPGRLKRKGIATLLKKPIEEITDEFTGAFHMTLEDDMLTIRDRPVRIDDHISGKEYKKHLFFEGSSIRKVNGRYYFIYSSLNNHELCYAVSEHPDREFVYGGTIVSNGDVGYQGRKGRDRLNHTGTNHGSIELINDQWYVFYHRLTHNSDYSRQACAERIEIRPDGSIPQVEMTSCGLNGGPLKEGHYPAVICCNLTNGRMKHGGNRKSKSGEPCVISDNEERFITNITNNTIIRYKYFQLNGSYQTAVWLKGDRGVLEIYLNDDFCSSVSLTGYDSWTKVISILNDVPEGTYSLTLKYRGKGTISVKEIEIRRQEEKA